MPAGGQLFGLVSAHAPIDATAAEEKAAWWDQLRGVVRKLPRRAIPVILADCNARFASCVTTDTVSEGSAVNGNAVALQQFCADFDLSSSTLHEPGGPASCYVGVAHRQAGSA